MCTLLAAAPRRNDETITGTVVSVDNGTLLLGSFNAADIVEMRVLPDAVITLNGKPAKLFQLQNGDHAAVRVDWRRPVPLAMEIDASSPY